MPHHKSAEKRLRQNEKARMRNKSRKSKIKSSIRKLNEAIEEKNHEAMDKNFKTVEKLLDKAATKKLIHTNKAARDKARFSRLIREAKEAS